MKNKFCEKSVLRNESDVEQFFVTRLLKDLEYKDTNILTKHTIPAYVIGKGQKRQSHVPDYQLRIGKTPTLIIEVKNPEESIDKYITEAQDYAIVVNRGFIGKNPIQFVLATNGMKTKLARIDENNPVLELNFDDFYDSNEKYQKLKKMIALSNFKKTTTTPKEEVFEFRTPDLKELKGILTQAHELIRRKQKIGPKKAFYEFTKVLFVKMNEDKKIQEKQDSGKEISVKDFKFSVYAIETINENWINTLFQEYRDKLEDLVNRGEKKRIFQKDERINLSASTIKAIVEMIENFNLRSVEDDINGKVFETFLEATVRGKELGQFFTPRSVVKFMTKMAMLRIKKNAETDEYEPDRIIDGSCGTGGFLIFALSDLFDKAKIFPTDQEKLKKRIREDALFGIDASEDDIVPITRMNMYLHGDGGSHIFLADTLDKYSYIEPGTVNERETEINEVKTLLENQKFDVVLTNPPFSMKYEQNKPDEKRILEQYELANLGGGLVRSLKSNIMFIERYHDLLKPGGKLLTVIDESVLNTEGQGKIMQKFRKWLRERFIIRAIISLPKNTFVNADTVVKTSVLYLTKKTHTSEKQPKVFMAISTNIGHNDAGRVTDDKDGWGDLGDILNSFKKFENGYYK